MSDRNTARGVPQPAAPAVGEGTVRAGSGKASLSLPAGKRVSVAVLAGPQRGVVVPLERPTLLIGRKGGDCGADLEVVDPEMSRAHAAVECYGHRVVLRDLASTNGTFVNEQRVEEAEIENHAEFRVGRTRLLLIVSDAE